MNSISGSGSTEHSGSLSHIDRAVGKAIFKLPAKLQSLALKIAIKAEKIRSETKPGRNKVKDNIKKSFKPLTKPLKRLSKKISDTVVKLPVFKSAQKSGQRNHSLNAFDRAVGKAVFKLPSKLQPLALRVVTRLYEKNKLSNAFKKAVASAIFSLPSPLQPLAIKGVTKVYNYHVRDTLKELPGKIHKLGTKAQLAIKRAAKDIISNIYLAHNSLSPTKRAQSKNDAAKALTNATVKRHIEISNARKHANSVLSNAKVKVKVELNNAKSALDIGEIAGYLNTQEKKLLAYLPPYTSQEETLRIQQEFNKMRAQLKAPAEGFLISLAEKTKNNILDFKSNKSTMNETDHNENLRELGHSCATTKRSISTLNGLGIRFTARQNTPFGDAMNEIDQFLIENEIVLM